MKGKAVAMTGTGIPSTTMSTKVGLPVAPLDDRTKKKKRKKQNANLMVKCS